MRARRPPGRRGASATNGRPRAPVAPVGAASGRAADPARWWAWPQVLLPAIAFALAATVAAAVAFRPGVAPPPPAPAVDATTPRVAREVRYVVVDALGLERPAFATVELARDLADDPGTRLTAALAALRDELVARDAWPAAVAAPRAFVFELDRQRVAVIDVGRPDADEPVSVAVELAALRSVAATARAEADAETVRVVVDGAPAASLWGRVATADPER